MDSKGVIWLINKDAAPTDVYATHLRTVRQAQYFQEQGYDVKLICSANVHNKNLNYVDNGWFTEQIHDGVNFVFVKSLEYGNSNLKRILAYFLFSLNTHRLCRHLKSPDIIIHTSRIPFDYPIYLLSKRKKAKYILDITDLWPMEFEHFGYLSKKNPILNLFYRIEKFLYTKADSVVMSMEGCHDYIKDKGWDIANGGSIDLAKVHYVNNGIDVNEFYENIKKFKIEDKDLEDKQSVKVIYLGSIRKANNVSALIDTAKYLQPHNIKLLIYGNGPERAVLEARCQDENLDNVIFKQQWVEPKFVPYILTQASVNILNYAEGWAPYGGSMNKMFMSMVAGKPIVCNAGMRYSPIRDNALGVDEFFKNAEEYANAIIKTCSLSEEEKKQIAERSRSAIMDYHIPNLNQRFRNLCNL